MISPLILQIPFPRDIPLDLPLPEGVLKFLLIASFLLHILFVNLMIGGTILTFWYELKGLKNKKYDSLAHEIGRTITVNKSLAVVLGVAPLLTINALYTIYFYSANALTGAFWISIVPLVTVAFMLTYIHRYTWGKMKNNKGLHLFFIGFSVFLFVTIPFIFLTNINLMMFPDKWSAVKGFLSALTMPNVIPRYFHFMSASLSVSGLFFFWFYGQKRIHFEERVKGISRNEARREIFTLAFVATSMQLVFGPFLLLTLPSRGVDWNMVLIILGGASLAIFALTWMWKALTNPEKDLDKRFYKIVFILAGTVILMGTGRQVYRANALVEHQKLISLHASHHAQLVEKAKTNALLPDSVKQKLSPGEQLFEGKCAVCHTMDTRLVGPPVREMIEIYESNPEDMKAWIKEPGRKRMDYPPMTGFPMLTNEELTHLTDYLLGLNI